MKKLLLFLFLAFIADMFPQTNHPSTILDMTLFRIEEAINSRSISSIEDLWGSSVTLRIEDSLYKDIPAMEAETLVSDYLLSKESVEFRFTTGSTGRLSFVEEGKKRSVAVDFNMYNYNGRFTITSLNMSNKPSANSLL